MDNIKSDAGQLRELALFAGAGGGLIGSHMLGWKPVCAVEYAEYPRSVLVSRQNDGTLPPFPIWDDVRTFNGKPWQGIVDIISGGFPCQDISAAGAGAGIEGEKSGLWTEMARIISEVRPRYVWVENSPLLIQRGLAVVLGDLAKMGYDAKWGIVGANDAGAPHVRKRCWILAYTRSARREGHRESAKPNKKKFRNATRSSWWEAEPQLGRMANGVAYRVERLKAIGNGQCPQAMKLAWEILSDD